MSGLLPQPLVFSNRGIQLTQCQHFFMYVRVSVLSSFLCSPIYISPCNCVEHGKWDLPKWVSAFRDSCTLSEVLQGTPDALTIYGLVTGLVGNG